MTAPLLREIQTYVSKTFPKYGRNKSQEIVRLLYEISQREKSDPYQIIPQSAKNVTTFHQLKKYLFSRRFPTSSNISISDYSLPSMKIKKSYQVNIDKDFNFEPEDIFIEKSVSHTNLALTTRKKYANKNIHEIDTYKEYIRKIDTSINSYNDRCKRLFIIKENHNFFLPCPCANKAVSCGYHIFNLGIGCPFECVYCHLQCYINAPGIVLPANIKDFFQDFNDYPKHIRLGTGQFTDSLALDNLTHYSKSLVHFFRQYPDTLFELKTKSVHIKSLLDQKACPNIIIAWSMNPPCIVDTMEFYTATFTERLNAAIDCAQAGYKVAFHFDPIICIPGWEQEYKTTVDKILSSVSPNDVAWISLGGLRLSPLLKQVIENRFPGHPILNEELVLGFDRKLRYTTKQRIDIYQKMLRWIRKNNRTTPVYLCMEEPQIFKACQLESYRY